MKFQDNTHEKGNGIAVTITIHQAKLSCDEAELLSGVACGLLWERSLFFGFTYRYCLLPLGLSRRQTFSSGKVIRLNFFIRIGIFLIQWNPFIIIMVIVNISESVTKTSTRYPAK